MTETYTLSVFVPLTDPNAHHVAHVFCIQVERGLTWVREHADELARKALPNSVYDALMVQPGWHPFR